MRLSIYKSGQGYWTRMLSAIGFGVIVLAGVAWIVRHLGGITDDKTRWITQSSTAGGIIFVFGLLLLYLLNQPNIVAFMIATESEMRKVHWTSLLLIIGSTLVVIFCTTLFCLFLWLINLASALLFKKIGVLA